MTSPGLGAACPGPPPSQPLLQACGEDKEGEAMAVLPLATSPAALKPPRPACRVHGTPRDRPRSAWIRRRRLVGQVLGSRARVWDVAAAPGLATSGRFNLSRPVPSPKTRAVAGLAAGLRVLEAAHTRPPRSCRGEIGTAVCLLQVAANGFQPAAAGTARAVGGFASICLARGFCLLGVARPAPAGPCRPG